MKYCVEKVITDDLFNKNGKIFNDKTKITFILILIAIPQEKDICDYNINLLKSTDYKNKDEFIQDLKKEGFKTIDEKNFFYENEKNFSEMINIEKDKSICIKNVKLNINKNLNLRKEELYNYEYILNESLIKRKINQIRKFLGNIFCSKLFKEILEILYPPDIKFPFDDKTFVYEYLNEYLNFIPLKSMTSNAFTDKLTCEIYIFLQKKIFFVGNDLFKIKKDDIELIKSSLYISALIKTNIQETNHNFYNYFYYSSNGTIPFKTPRKKELNIRESGRHIELLLFNRIVNQINLGEAMYILNENNYNKSINEFNKGFNDLNDEDLNIRGVFEEFNYIKKIENIKDLEEETLIVADPGGGLNISGDCFIEIKDENDVIGA